MHWDSFPLPPSPSLLATQTLPIQAINCGLTLPQSSPEMQQRKAVTLWPGVMSEEGVCMPAGTETFQRERGSTGRASTHLQSNESQAGQLSCVHANREREQIPLTPNYPARGELQTQSASEIPWR